MGGSGLAPPLLRAPPGPAVVPRQRQAHPRRHMLRRGRATAAVSAASASPFSSSVFYFGYGSNLNTTVLTGRRGVKPARVVPVVVRDFALQFSVPGVPYLEPAFATVVQEPGASLHGIACEVSPEQWEVIKLTERGYDVIDVCCTTYAGEELQAQTLIIPESRRRQGLRPSRRYIELIKEGACEWNLDKEWQQYLRQIPAYDPFESSEQQVGALVSMASALPIGVSTGLSVIGARLQSGDPFQDGSELEEQFSADWARNTWELHDALKGVFGDGGTTSRK